MKPLQAAACALLALAADPALAKGRVATPVEIIRHHIAAANKRDVAGVMSDYAPGAVLLQAGEAFQGKAAIARRIDSLSGPHAPPQPGFTPIRIWQEGEVGMVTWKTDDGSMEGADSFWVRGGKIQAQAVFITRQRNPSP